MGTARGKAAAALAALATAAALLSGAPATAATDDETAAEAVEVAAATAATGPGALMTVYRHHASGRYALGVATPRGDDRVALDFGFSRWLTGEYQDIDAAEVLAPGRGSAVLLLSSGVANTWSVLEHRGARVTPRLLATGRLSRSYHTAAMLEHEGRGYALFVGGDQDTGAGYYALMAVDPRTGALRLASTGTMSGGDPWKVSDLGDGEALVLVWHRSGTGGDRGTTSSSLQRWQVQGSGTSARLVRTTVSPLSRVHWDAERVETDGDPATREVVLHGYDSSYAVVRFRATGGPSLLGQGSLPYSQDFPVVRQLGDPDHGVSPLVVGSFVSPYARGLAVTGPARFRAGVASVAPMTDAAWVVAPAAP